MLFDTLSILQVADGDPAPACRRAVEIAGRLALDGGATVLTGPRWRSPSAFGGRHKRPLDGTAADDPVAWARGSERRLLLIAGSGEPGSIATDGADIAAVRVDLEPWHSEATLFAESGLADQLGDPARPPQIGRAHV